MSIARKTERNAMRAAFAAGCDRLYGGQHRFMRTLGMQRTVVGSIPSICKTQRLEPQDLAQGLNDWRGG
jgi:hypothetical protein